MIFVTVGTQLPFPRLMDAMESIAETWPEPVVAQTGDDQSWPCMEASRSFDMATMTRLFHQARVIVAHAGIGTVLAARSAGRPVVLVPRRAALGEHRNDHQRATALALDGEPGIRICWYMHELKPLLTSAIEPPSDSRSEHHDSLVSAVRAFVAA